MATPSPRPIARTDLARIHSARIAELPRSEPSPGRHAKPCAAPRRLPGTSSRRRPNPLHRRASDPAAGHSSRAAAALFRLMIDVLDQRRDTGHLRRAATPAVIDLLAERSKQCPASMPPARILSVHVRPVTAHCIEASCTCERGQRVFAIAARFEISRHGAWHCTALDLG
ncbi:hypothetical protein HT102_09000 [Hoyosella sp. G463]|uniref:Alanine, arginine and proline rich protein n=1 Tax=Lolliginicoccus lacisalsi TaxID=2742202 RepID=A0A927JCI8_9ACTN|nr:Rv3235 family protein [Lolliginicoccus lacisalsi]MBD8506623.1 hypothetical protein [Lolliginicoccus lacisalsi]